MNFKQIQDFIKSKTSSSRWVRGINYFNKKLVDHVTFNINESILSFEGVCESEYFNEVYSNYISVNVDDLRVIETKCNCEDFISRCDMYPTFICKHIAATAISGLQSAKKDYAESLISQFKNEVEVVKIPTHPNKQLLFYFDDSKREFINLDVNITIDSDKIYADFKIGQDKMYVLKNLKDFAYAKNHNDILEYGKNFTFNPSVHYFYPEDEKIVDIIENYGSNLALYLSASNPKLMQIGQSEFKHFLKLLENKDFTLVVNGTEYCPNVFDNQLPIAFDLINCDGKIELSTNSNLPIPLNLKGDVLLYNDDIYLLSNDQASDYNRLYSAINKYNTLIFEKEDIQGVLSNLIPKISKLCKDINIDDNIKNNIVSDFKTEFYFDIKGSSIICNLKFIYDDENGQKFILKDLDEQDRFKDILTSHKFNLHGNSYIFKGDDLDLYNFLSEDIQDLKNHGEVYYSDKFKSRKILNTSSIKASIRSGIDGYLEFNFDIKDINKDEYKDIMIAFKDNSKFYKLKNGSFLNLEQEQTKDFFELLENMNFIEDDISKIQNNKVLYLNHMLETKKLDFISGKDLIEDISNKFYDLTKINNKLPDNLNATLRDYQVDGFNWFNTLDHYNFSGILADEMGLGKTIQTITFLLSKSEENKKTIIVTPTSLIYNWKNEFETFAPSLNVLLIHGSKKEREKSLEEIDNYDVIITTYGTLRNDLESYTKKTFDYCIIDEAQNIKNPVALSTEAVKSIKSKVRFALTGTPIENNLLELWSIFDFVMPGYLYNRSKFQGLFINNSNNNHNLKRLIKPFILRRTKSEVMKELPDKIEKKFFVELNKDQRKVYSAYVSELSEKMKDKNIKKDRIVIFSYLTKLRQLCLDPSIIVEDYNKRSSKIDTSLEIIKDYIDNNHKILLFSQFTSVLKNLGDELNKNNIDYLYIDGQTNARNRMDLVNSFNNSDDNKVFLISLKAGGTGLNLTSADVVIHFDPWWNPSVENQASDRAHRFGQKNSVEVIKLIAKGTIEEKILLLQENKNKLIQEFINGDLSNQNMLKSLSDKEIIDLFI